VGIGDPRALAPLVAALADSDPRLRRAVVETLGKIGDVRAAESLMAALKDDESSMVRFAAARALGKIGDPRAVEPLVTALGDVPDHEFAPDVREAASEALEKIGAPAVESLVAALKDKDYAVRRLVANVLGGIGDPRATEPLAAASEDGDSGTREEAALALGKIGDLRAVEPLVALLTGRRRQEAAKVLREIGAPSIGPLVGALKDGDSETRQAAAEVLVEMPDPRAAEALKSQGWEQGLLVFDAICDRCGHRIRFPEDAFAVAEGAQVLRIYCGRCYGGFYERWPNENVEPSVSNKLAVSYLHRTGRIRHGIRFAGIPSGEESKHHPNSV